MLADWEVEIGGGAPVIEALWPGFINLRRSPERIGEIHEAAAFPPLAALLLALNGPASPLWTAKCDLWQPEPDRFPEPDSDPAPGFTLACYVDLLPLDTRVFAHWQLAERFCREWVALLDPVSVPQAQVELIVRQAIAADAEGFAITAYLAATGPDQPAAAANLTAALVAFACAIPANLPPKSRYQSYNGKVRASSSIG